MKITSTPVVLAVLLLCPCITRADVKMPAIFGDHMVLQQEAKLPVWGWAGPGEKVTVTFGSAKAEATAGPDGKWRVDLPAVLAGTPPGTLVVAGKNTITLSDVLVGEVWVCSGQSNMEFYLGSPGVAANEDHRGTDNQLRLFHVTNRYCVVPNDDVQGTWQPYSFKVARDFSGVAYFFGKNLRAALKRPVGLIESAQGGSGVQEWTSLAALEAVPDFQAYVDKYKAFAASCPNTNDEFAAKLAAERLAGRDWSITVQADASYQAALKAWKDAVSQAQAAGQRPPPEPAPPIRRPIGTINLGNIPSLLFNGMINGLVPFAIKGAIWYQGEGNTHNQDEAFGYRTRLSTLIADWRTRWAQGDYPFLIVQLANAGPVPKNAGDPSNWAMLRESQVKILALPNTGLAVTIDIGEGDNVHYPDKADVGARLALAARHVAYGENFVYTGPIYDAMKVEGGKIRVSFKKDSVESGLVIGSSPRVDPKAPPVSKTELQSFAIAGDDKNWVWAEAKIDGETVVVFSPRVANPVAVRYAWADNPACNLYNKEGLPASPFRTDTWVDVDPSPAPRVPATTSPTTK